MSGCLICGVDDGLWLLCGAHWSEYQRWRAQQEDVARTQPVSERAQG